MADIAGPARRVIHGGRRMDDLLSRLSGYSTATPRTHSGVLFQPGSGLGGVPDGGNIDYRGFQAYMRPGDFLGVNPPRPLDQRPIDHIVSAIQAGEPIGTPMLYVRREGAGWGVKGHEGRGRMMALREIAPDQLFPVGVHPYGELRARHLSPDDLFLRIFPDAGGSSTASPSMAIWNQSPHVRPGMESDEAVLRALMELSASAD